MASSLLSRSRGVLLGGSGAGVVAKGLGVRGVSGLQGPTPVRMASPALRATVFGAYGFVGNYVVSKLAADGIQCMIPWRGDDMEWRHLKVQGDLGVVQPINYSPRDDDSIRRSVEGSDIVINLIGKVRGVGSEATRGALGARCLAPR